MTGQGAGPEDAIHDVAIVGFGPVGATLAALLAPWGYSVAVFERSTTVFPLPRAAHLDHEVMRVFDDAGVAEAVLPATTPVKGTLDPEVAAARNQQLRDHPELAPKGEPGEMLPPLGPSVLQRDEAGAVVAPAGTCFINPRLDDPFNTPLDKIARFFTVLTRSDAPSWSIAWGEGEDEEVDGLGPRLRPGGWDSELTVPEVDARLDEHGIAAVILRPDHYVWGVARRVDELPELVEQLAGQLGHPS